MTEAEWDGTEDWPKMLYSLLNFETTRKLRLWCVAWARAILTVPSDYWQTPNALDYFEPRSLAAYARETDASEAFADGRITRGELAAAKYFSGGPFHVFHLPSTRHRLTSERIIPDLRRFVREYHVPTDDQLAVLLRDIFGNPFRPVAFAPEWRTDTAVTLARTMYESREFSAMPILADALQDAGCDNPDILDHCRGEGPHLRGCWVTDLVLGRH